VSNTHGIEDPNNEKNKEEHYTTLPQHNTAGDRDCAKSLGRALCNTLYDKVHAGHSRVLLMSARGFGSFCVSIIRSYDLMLRASIIDYIYIYIYMSFFIVCLRFCVVFCLCFLCEFFVFSFLALWSNATKNELTIRHVVYFGFSHFSYIYIYIFVFCVVSLFCVCVCVCVCVCFICFLSYG